VFFSSVVSIRAKFQNITISARYLIAVLCNYEPIETNMKIYEFAASTKFNFFSVAFIARV